MHEICKRCPDKFSESCALPSRTNVAIKHAAIVGAMIIEGCARVGASIKGEPLEPDSTSLVGITKLQKDAMYVSVEACAYLHFLQEPY